MSDETCVTFPNKEGLLLRGIVHPANPHSYRSVSLIMLNTGLNDMVGWHRLQVKIARHCAQKGYNVLRFDNVGIGESDGELEEGDVTRIMTRIEQGLWRDDALSALDFCCETFKGDRMFYMGFCGGGLNAIHAAAKDPRIRGVINVAAPITLSSQQDLNNVTTYDVQKNMESYKRKLVNVRSLINFLSGRSEYDKVFRTLKVALRQVFEKLFRRVSSRSQEPVPGNLNREVFRSFETYLHSNRPTLFYYAGLDRATWALKTYFLPKFDKERNWKESCEFLEVDNANHIFSDQDTQEHMKQTLVEWLERVA